MGKIRGDTPHPPGFPKGLWGYPKTLCERKGVLKARAERSDSVVTDHRAGKVHCLFGVGVGSTVVATPNFSATSKSTVRSMKPWESL